MKFDLHLHSCYSDGKFCPTEVAEACQKAGLSVASLTDHENTRGTLEFVEAASSLGVKTIPGIELTSQYRKKEFHILGYFIDYLSPKLHDFLARWRKVKISQMRKMVSKLQDYGFKVNLEEILETAPGSVNRPHIAWAVYRGYRNLAILERHGLETQGQFFGKFLADDGLAFQDRRRPHVGEVIALIHSIGGMAFWAHPLWKKDRNYWIERTALDLRKLGLDGIETGYSFYSREQTEFLHQIASDFCLFESGGSDFHWSDGRLNSDGNKREVGGFQAFGLELNLPFRFEEGRVRRIVNRYE